MPEVVLPQSLQERIAQESYRPATDDDLSGGVTSTDVTQSQRVDQGEPQQPEAEQGAPPSTPADNQPYGTAPAGMPVYDPAAVQQIAERAQRLEAENQRLQMEKRIADLQADEQRFADSIASYPAWQQEQMLHERERQQAQTINQYLQGKVMELTNQVSGQGAAEQAKAEQVAKRLVAYHKATAAGLDFQNPVIFDALAGEHVLKPEQMDRAIQGFLSLGVAGGQKPIIAGGARATNAGATAPRKGSGDLAGLINSRSYELVPAE